MPYTFLLYDAQDKVVCHVIYDIVVKCITNKYVE